MMRAPVVPAVPPALPAPDPTDALRVLVVGESPALVAGVGALLAAEGVAVAGVARTASRLGAAVRRAGATAVAVAPLEVSERLLDALDGGVPGVVLLADGALRVHAATIERDTRCSCLPLTATAGELARALRAAAAPASLEGIVAMAPVAVGAAGRLTAREQEVLTALAEGLANREIADRLQISGETVKSHLSRVYRKLEVRTRAEAVGAFLAHTA